jgi:hypothetical protein
MADAKSDKPKQKRTIKPVYVVFRVTDNNGSVIHLTKDNVEVIAVHKDADSLLTLMDSGLEEGCFYKRVALD